MLTSSRTEFLILISIKKIVINFQLIWNSMSNCYYHVLINYIDYTSTLVILQNQQIHHAKRKSCLTAAPSFWHIIITNMVAILDIYYLMRAVLSSFFFLFEPTEPC